MLKKAICYSTHFRTLPLILLTLLLAVGQSCRISLPQPGGNTTVNNTQPTRDDNLALGNPSGASAGDPNNYLISKSALSISYNRKRGIANWVSWHLSSAWKGEQQRSNAFRPDPQIPTDWFAAKTSDYNNTGFDRGHLCPSDDRDGSAEDNATTFLLTNIVPQAPRHNREVWKELEDYCRKLMAGNNELYIIAGTDGTGGTGANGELSKLADGKITVPQTLWKVVVVLPVGSNDLSRINTNTRVFAVNISNRQTAADKPWKYYLLSIDELERRTGYDFLSNLPQDLQHELERRIDGANS
jgi:endonuclease G, mitochondrial